MLTALARAALGILFFCAVSWLLSSDRKRFPWRVLVFSLLLQFLLAGWILGTELGQGIFHGLSTGVTHLIGMAAPGAKLVFGNLSEPGEWGFVFAFAGTGLAALIFFSALMSVLYHIGVMQVVIYAMARVMTFTMGVSGAESMAMAANVFVGQTEAPLVVRPYIERMTRSELFALMTGGFATIAGTVLGVYMGLLGPEYGPHLISASVMSAPAAFLIAKIMVPECEQTATGKNVELRIERNAHNLIEAASMGAADGMKLWLNVIAMLIAFMGLVNLVDWILLGAGGATDGVAQISLARIFAWLFAPVSWLMGVDGWHDCRLFGTLLGTKVSVNEFVAYSRLQGMLPGAAGELPHFEAARSAKMAAYALCGFANFASIGIQIGGITPLAPSRRTDLARLGLRAMLGGAFASWMTATIAGVFL